MFVAAFPESQKLNDPNVALLVHVYHQSPQDKLAPSAEVYVASSTAPDVKSIYGRVKVDLTNNDYE